MKMKALVLFGLCVFIHSSIYTHTHIYISLTFRSQEVIMFEIIDKGALPLLIVYIVAV